jgi:hypothetical protein
MRGGRSEQAASSDKDFKPTPSKERTCMDAWKLTVVLLAVWTLIRFWIHPLLGKNWTNGALSSKVMRAGTLAAVEMARNLLLRVLHHILKRTGYIVRIVHAPN